MFKFSLAALLAVSTLTLAACGSDDASTAATAAAAAPVASTSVGTIDRSQTTPSAATTNTDTAAAVASNTTTTTTAPAVTSTTDGAATLDWTPPTENTDGSTLTNLAGYTVYYGTSPDNLNQSVKVTNAGLSAYTVTNLTSGTWYFAVTSVSAAGVESSRTGVVSTTI